MHVHVTTPTCSSHWKVTERLFYSQAVGLERATRSLQNIRWTRSFSTNKILVHVSKNVEGLMSSGRYEDIFGDRGTWVHIVLCSELRTSPFARLFCHASSHTVFLRLPACFIPGFIVIFSGGVKKGVRVCLVHGTDKTPTWIQATESWGNLTPAFPFMNRGSRIR